MGNVNFGTCKDVRTVGCTYVPIYVGLAQAHPNYEQIVIMHIDMQAFVSHIRS